MNDPLVKFLLRLLAFTTRFPIVMTLCLMAGLNIFIANYFIIKPSDEWIIAASVISSIILFLIFMASVVDGNFAYKIRTTLIGNISPNAKIYMGFRMIDNATSNKFTFDNGYSSAYYSDVALLQLYGVYIQYKIFNHINSLISSSNNIIESK